MNNFRMKQRQLYISRVIIRIFFERQILYVPLTAFVEVFLNATYNKNFLNKKNGKKSNFFIIYKTAWYLIDRQSFRIGS